MRKTLRVRLVATDRTDLICMRCGHFRCEQAVVFEGLDARDAHAGIHKKCAKVPRKPKIKAYVSLDTEPAPDTFLPLKPIGVTRRHTTD